VPSLCCQECDTCWRLCLVPAIPMFSFKPSSGQVAIGPRGALFAALQPSLFPFPGCWRWLYERRRSPDSRHAAGDYTATSSIPLGCESAGLTDANPAKDSGAVAVRGVVGAQRLFMFVRNRSQRCRSENLLTRPGHSVMPLIPNPE
jgi:hypothetical protein